MRKRLKSVDRIVEEGLAKKAFPGAVVMAVHKGNVLYSKAFGNLATGENSPVAPENI